MITLVMIRQFRDPIAIAGGPAGHLYRSARLFDATEADRTALSHMLYGGRVIDLRTPGRAGNEPDPRIVGVENITVSLPPTVYVGYPHIVRENRKELRTIMRLLTRWGPSLVHCTEGKDRTGIVVALLMLAAGYSEHRVRKEFVSTPDAPGDSLQQMFAAMRADAETYDLRRWFMHENGLGMRYDEYALLGSRYSA